MSKYVIKIIISVFLIASKIVSQNGFDAYLQKDSIYRFNTSLKTLDSLLIFQTKPNYKDTAFYSSFSKGGSVSLSQLLFAAVNNYPDLSAMQIKIEGLNYQAEEKTYLPDPMFEFELDDIMSDFKKVGMINFFVSQMFPFPGKLSLEKKLVFDTKSMMQAERLSMAVDVMNMIKMNYYDLYLIDRKLEINKDNQLIMKTFITAAESQYMVGKGMQQEIFKAQIEMSRLKNEEFIFFQQRKNILSELTKLTKIIFSENTRFNYNDIDIDFILKYESFYFKDSKAGNLIDYAFEHRADIKALQQKMVMNKTDIEMAKLNRMPDFNLKLGYKILPFEEKNGFAFMIGINLPFAPWSSGKYDYLIKKYEINLKSTSAEYEAKKNEIRNEITTIINNMTYLKETMNFYYGVQIPQTENTLKSTQYSYETNMTGFLDLLDSYKMYQEARFMFYESVSMYLKMIAELEKATGINLKSSN